MSTRSLIVLPDESSKPFLDAIHGARKSLQVKMFVFSDPGLLSAVVAAHLRGVKVRIMLNAARRDGEDDNQAVRLALEEAGVEVKDSSPDFGITHEKSMVVDEAVGFVKSLNWATQNLVETRDYAITTTHPHGVREMIACFDGDWNRQEFKPGDSAHLIWCPANGRERIARFIDEAKHTLFIQNERYQDTVIIERLVRARERGVKIHLMARPPHALKKEKIIEGVGGLRIMDDVGIKVHKLKHLKLHGKMLLADGLRAIVGSINLAPGSFDDRRELAIEVHDDEIVDRLHNIARHDWEHSAPLDLTDAGLFVDLEEHGHGGAEKLVLRMDDAHEKKHTRNHHSSEKYIIHKSFT
ncbi:MAG: phospholipase D-like domain-containing protein [Bacteroidales bacterium]